MFRKSNIGKHTEIVKGVRAAHGAAFDGAILVPKTGSFRELMDQMNEVDAVVATRFHNVVSALKLGKPTVSVGYAAKNQVLMEDMGVGEYALSLADADAASIIRMVERVLDGRVEIGRRIAARADAMEGRLRSLFAALDQLVVSSACGAGDPRDLTSRASPRGRSL